MKASLSSCVFAFSLILVQPLHIKGAQPSSSASRSVRNDDDFDEIVFRLKQADASRAVNRLRSLIDEKANITIKAQTKTNSVLIRADKNTIARAVKFLKQLDAEIDDVGLFVIKLKCVDAVKVGIVLKVASTIPFVFDDEHIVVTVNADTNTILLHSKAQSFQIIRYVLEHLGLLK